MAGILMKRVLIILYVFLLVVLMLATFVEAAYGTSFVHRYVYGNKWFVLLWALLVAGGLCAILKKGMWRRPPVFLLHLSLVLILCGAAFTYFTAERGFMHLQKDVEPINEMKAENEHLIQLPFYIGLDSFQMVTYPGTDTPADYVSHLYLIDDFDTISCSVSMNNIYTYRGYRIYQSSFDDDMQGSWITLNHDVWGITVTYVAYGLLFFSAFLLLVLPKTGFRSLMKHPLLKRMSILLFFIFSMDGIQAAVPVLNRIEADSLSYIPVVYNGRIAPYSTAAHDFVTKLYGHPSYNELTPEQVMASWKLYPEQWSEERMFKVKNKRLRRLLAMDGSYIALSGLYDSYGYKLQRFWTRVDKNDKQLLDAIRELDEKVALVIMLHKGTLFTAPPDNMCFSLQRIRMECIYNRISLTTWLYRVNMFVGLLGFAGAIVIFLTSTVCPLWIHRVLRVQLFLTFFLLACWIALRWYISAHVPLSNGYETMLFIAWLVTGIILLLRPMFLLTSVALLLSGCMLLVADLSAMSPAITSLVPVLNSSWLTLHVSVIMFAYALLAIVTLIALAALVMTLCSKSLESDESVKGLALMGQLMLYPALLFLGIGIFLGAIWANNAWGRYWGWDPKEVWALITFLLYALPFHLSVFSPMHHPKRFHLFLLLAFLSVIMTYFGVNFLGGMHSYQ